jgi:cell division protein FtsI (penicillin-binding protein 3)
MQIMAAATAITNGGVLLKPLLVKKIVSPQGTVVKEFGREPLWEVISVDSARAMLSWMESATLPAGTAHRAAIEGVRISAKTGTAQVASARTGAYSESDFIASMIGIFPSDDPRIIVYVVVQNPRGQSYYGSQIAAPVFREVALRLIDKLGIPRAGTMTAAAAANTGPASARADSSRPKAGGSLSNAGTAMPSGDPAQSLSAAAGAGSPASLIVPGSVMPDLRGLPKKLLLPLLLRSDLLVTMSGSGYVVSQNPPPGTRVQDGMRIDLELR